MADNNSKINIFNSLSLNLIDIIVEKHNILLIKNIVKFIFPNLVLKRE